MGATRKVDPAEHCSPTACVSAVKLAAPSGVTPRVLEATLSAVAMSTAAGYYRVHLTHEDRDSLTVFVPIDEHGYYEAKGGASS